MEVWQPIQNVASVGFYFIPAKSRNPTPFVIPAGGNPGGGKGGVCPFRTDMTCRAHLVVAAGLRSRLATVTGRLKR